MSSSVAFPKKFKEDLVQFDSNFLVRKTDLTRGMYLIAICSSRPINIIKSHAILASSVDEFLLSKGVEEMTRIFVTEKDQKINMMESELAQIKDSKIFIIWRIYNYLKGLIKR